MLLVVYVVTSIIIYNQVKKVTCLTLYFVKTLLIRFNMLLVVYVVTSIIIYISC